MEIDKNKNITGEGEVKKKKYSVVFRAANSQQNSLKTRPQGTAPAKKPATPGAARPSAPGTARPAAPKPAVKPRPAPSKKAETSGETAKAESKPKAAAKSDDDNAIFTQKIDYSEFKKHKKPKKNN